jgi:DNA-binding MarR family transcriptional regulator
MLSVTRECALLPAMKNDDLFKLICLTRPLLQEIELAVQENLIGTGLTVGMRAVLQILFLHGPMTVPNLARQLEIQRQYVQELVNRNCEEGYTARESNPAHKRSFLIALTPKGKALIGQVLDSEFANIETFSHDISHEDVLVALRVSNQILEGFRILNRRDD